MKLTKLFGLLLLITSCSYSISYRATYTIQNSSPNIQELLRNDIQKLADNNKLSEDNRYFNTDTIGYYGKPYHYFKFWIEKKDSLTLLNLYYWGTSIGSGKPTYDSFLTNLNDSIQSKYTPISKDAKQDVHPKPGK